MKKKTTFSLISNMFASIIHNPFNNSSQIQHIRKKGLITYLGICLRFGMFTIYYQNVYLHCIIKLNLYKKVPVYNDIIVQSQVFARDWFRH